MRVDLTLVAACAALAVSFVAIWSNPGRAVNRVFLTLSLHAALWLLSLRAAIFSAQSGLFWLRMACAVGAFIPLHFWFVKEAIVTGRERFLKTLARSRWWLVAAVVLAVISFTTWFIPTRETTRIAAAQVYGLGYYVYVIGLLCVYAAVCREAVLQMRAHLGVKKLELQIVLLGGSAAAGAVILLMALRAILAMPWLVRMQPLVILVFYTGTVLAITMHRIFDARQITFVGLQKFILVGLVTAVAYLLDRFLGEVLPEPFALLATTAIALWIASVLNAWLDRFFHFYPRETEARRAAFAVMRRELRIEGVEKGFLDLLKGWGQTEHALILVGTKGSFSGGGIVMAEGAAVGSAMRQLRWATPERLVRERPTPARAAVAAFLAEQRLGALVIGEGPALTTLVGVGVPASRRPYTYPQVTQLMELASIVEGALERAHFSVQAQHAEQLATVGLLGASLAHEIRNPLVTIKTFVQLLPRHHQDEAFRTKFFSLIGSEVERIDRLTVQLMDLASPRSYCAQRVELHPVLRSSLELVAAKAKDKHIELVTEFQASPDLAWTDASAARQVLLNLCFNAIQAVEGQVGERWVRVGTRRVAAGIEMLVEDSGPGIAPEIWPRLFQPFQSTKSSGFGLGLAICSDILAGLDATIGVDPSEPGRGASFRVVFPVPVEAAVTAHDY